MADASRRRRTPCDGWRRTTAAPTRTCGAGRDHGRQRGWTVTDALDRLAEPGDDLLRRVDALLSAAGIAPGGPVEPMLLRVGALPSDVLAYGLRLDVGALRASVAELRAVGDRFR